MRSISEKFEASLKGELKDLMDKIRKDSTLDFEIREDYIEVYYRGAELFSIEEKKKQLFFTKHENQYIKDEDIPVSQNSINDFIKSIIAKRKDILDNIGNTGPQGMERDVQQQIVKENNFVNQSIKTDYFITDIEYEIKEHSLRFDLLAAKSINNTKDRKTPPKKFAIIELKYDTGAIFSKPDDNTKSSLKGHFADLNEFIKQNGWKNKLKEEIMYSFNLKYNLDIFRIPENQKTSIKKITKNDLADKPEYIIIFANYNVNDLRQNPKDLSNELIDIKKSFPKVFEEFDVKIATAAFSGYGLYDEFMIPFDTFITTELENFNRK